MKAGYTKYQRFHAALAAGRKPVPGSMEDLMRQAIREALSMLDTVDRSIRFRW